MLKIKLVRTGKRNAPAFRIMAGSEILGSFNPSLNASKRFVLDKARFEYWLKQGAKMSSAIAQLIKGKYEFKRYAPKEKG